MTRSQGMPGSFARLLDQLARGCVEEAEHDARRRRGRARRGRPRAPRRRSVRPHGGGETKLVLGHAGPEALGRVQHRGQSSARGCPKPVPNASRPLGKRARSLETSLHGSEPSRVPAAGPAHGDRRRRADRRGRPEAASAARAAAAEREPRRPARAADRGAVRRPERQLGRSRAAQPRLTAAEGSEPGDGGRAAPCRAGARLPAQGRAGRARSRAVRAAGRGGP